MNIEALNEFLNAINAANGLDNDNDKKELLVQELNVGYNMFFDSVGKLLDELEENGYKSESFNLLCSIKTNIAYILEELGKLE